MPTPTPPIVLPIAAARALALDSVVTVVGTITVEPGRILGDREIVIQDATGGICVRLPSDADLGTLVRGRIVQATGKLAAPYANLELRLASKGDLSGVGSGGVPEARAATSTDLGEASEGQLLRLSGVVARIESGSSGSLAVTITDSAGEARIFFHGPLGIDRALFAVGSGSPPPESPDSANPRTGSGTATASGRATRATWRSWLPPRRRRPRATPTPRPTATPAHPTRARRPRPTATPRPTPAETARPTGRPKPSTSPDPDRLRIADALLHVR